MIVIADTSPLNYLIQIDCDSLLPKLYEWQNGDELRWAEASYTI
jgi:hypothetical protein